MATSILSQSQRTVETVAQNLSNMSTPGYKRRANFSSLYLSSSLNDAKTAKKKSFYTDFTAGKTFVTNNENDLALMGDGFFEVSRGSGAFYTRHGQFQRADDGRLINAQGYALQADGGGDIVLKPGDFQVETDGAVTQDGAPVAKLAVVDFANKSGLTAFDAGLFTAADGEPVKGSAAVKQGSLEASNVSTGDEMVSMMEALRRAETGQRMVMVYDDMMGRALNLFGQS